MGIRWTQTADKTTWCAAAGDLALTTSHLSSGQWMATVIGPYTDDRSPELATRVAAQNWAERMARGAAK